MPKAPLTLLQTVLLRHVRDGTWRSLTPNAFTVNHLYTLLSRLSRAGLLRGNKDPHDKRVRNYELTARGRSALSRSEPAYYITQTLDTSRSMTKVIDLTPPNLC
jgi:DNA-binding PadR family transcriptional regulator